MRRSQSNIGACVGLCLQIGMNECLGVCFICGILHRGRFKHLNLQCWGVKTVHLQSLQQSEVLKGSPLHDADLIVLQMTVGADTERQGETVIKYHNWKKKKKAKKQNQQKRFENHLYNQGIRVVSKERRH